MSTEITFTQSEHIICTLANLIEGDKSYWVAIGGQSLMAVLLARRLQAPNVCYVIEDGTVSPQPTNCLRPYPAWRQWWPSLSGYRLERREHHGLPLCLGLLRLWHPRLRRGGYVREYQL